MALKTIKLLVVVLYCLSEKQGLCGRLSKSELYMNISNANTFANKLGEKVLLAAKTYFGKNPLVNMLFPLTDDNNLMFELMVKINQKLNNLWKLLTNDNDLSKSKKYVTNHIPVWNKTDVYIVPLHQQDEFDKFKSQLIKLNTYASFNPRATFVFLKFINECGQYNRTNIWVPYFSELWKHEFFATIVFVLSKCDFGLTIITAKPFSLENRCFLANTQGIHCHTFSPEIEDTHYTKDTPRYFNGCSFVTATTLYAPFTFEKIEQNQTNKILTNNVGGLEIELVSLLSTKLGFTYEFHRSNDFKIYGCIYEYTSSKGNETESEISHRKIEFCLGGKIPNTETLLKYDIAFIYMFSELSWFVADAVVAPLWKIVFQVFSSDVWLLLAFVNLIFSLTYNTFEEYKCCGTKTTVESRLKRKNNYLELLRTFLGMSSKLKPQASQLRVLYFAWSLFSLYMNIAFSTRLFQLLRNPPFEKNITTIQDLYDSGLKVAGRSAYLNSFQDSNLSYITRSVSNITIECMSMEECYTQLSRYKNFSIMDRNEHVRYYIDLKKIKIHKVEQNMLRLGVSILMSKGNPLQMDMNKVVMQAFQCGLIKRLEKKTNRKSRIKYDEEIPREENSIPLSIIDLQTAFYLLNFGFVSSLLVFTFEVSWHWLKQKSNHKECEISNKHFTSSK